MADDEFIRGAPRATQITQILLFGSLFCVISGSSPPAEPPPCKRNVPPRDGNNEINDRDDEQRFQVIKENPSDEAHEGKQADSQAMKTFVLMSPILTLERPVNPVDLLHVRFRYFGHRVPLEQA